MNVLYYIKVKVMLVKKIEINRDLNASINLSLIPQAMREYKPRVA